VAGAGREGHAADRTHAATAPLTRLGLLDGDTRRSVVAQPADPDRPRKARVHPAPHCRPSDPGMLDVAGFDAAVPNLIADLSRRTI
jgi:hypothetical protein